MDGLLPRRHGSGYRLRLRERWETPPEGAGAKLSLKAAESPRGAAREGRLHLGECSFPLRTGRRRCERPVLGLRSARCKTTLSNAGAAVHGGGVPQGGVEQERLKDGEPP